MVTSWQISKFRHSFIQDVQLLAANTPKSGGDFVEINAQEELHHLLQQTSFNQRGI